MCSIQVDCLRLYFRLCFLCFFINYVPLFFTPIHAKSIPSSSPAPSMNIDNAYCESRPNCASPSSLLSPILNETILGRIVEFGDYNGDGYIDIFSLVQLPKEEGSEEGGSDSFLHIYLYNYKLRVFELFSEYKLALYQTAVAVIASDFDFDGYLDVLVVYDIYENAPSSAFAYEILVQEAHGNTMISAWQSIDSNSYSQYRSYNKKAAHGFEDFLGVFGFTNSPSFEELQQLPGDSFFSIHPLLVDVDLDGQIDILTQTFTSSTETPTRVVFLKDTNSTQRLAYRLFNWTDLTSFIATDASLADYGTIANPHSSAFIDINADSRPDIVLVVHNGEGAESRTGSSLKLEIWLNTYIKPGVYSLVVLPENY